MKEAIITLSRGEPLRVTYEKDDQIQSLITEIRKRRTRDSEPITVRIAETLQVFFASEVVRIAVSGFGSDESRLTDTVVINVKDRLTES
ncbi:MAG: hypothetical protein ACYS99_18135 [Planctomycetota bacterium]|jgi:hypothetical protein